MTTVYDFSLVKTYLHISPDGAHHLLDEMPAVDFLSAPRLVEMMRKTGKIVKATDDRLPGSFFGSSLCNLCVTKLIFLAMYGKVLELSLEQLTFQIDYEEGHGHPHLGYRINQVTALDIPADNGDAFVTEDWHSFLSGTVTPAVEAIAHAAKMNTEMIWQQFGGIVGWVKEFVRTMQVSPDVKERFDYHFRLLSEEISPQAFPCKRNPFQWEPRFVNNPNQPGERWLMRSACCHYDRREGGEKCFVCPRMTPVERETAVRRIQAASAV